jgi:zinc/manganese transport system substrate-binding protein
MFRKVLLVIIGVISFNFVLADPIKIVAAENFYGELAKEIGGDNVSVQSIITSPDADPHLFTTSPSISKALNNAQIIIYNGADYDPWMEQMLKSVSSKHATIINIADLMAVQKGANQHIWYKPATFPTLANKLSEQIIVFNPQSKAEVNKNLSIFLTKNKQVQNKIKQLQISYNKVPVTATEPVFGYMADAIGLDMKGLDFQWKIMNDTEPTPQMLANYQELITGHKVKVLFYNRQVTDPVTKNILALANTNHIPVVGVTETMPPQVTINQWLMNEINQTEEALKLSK